MKTDSDTMTIVNNMYLPISGIVIEVAGTISISSSWKILNDSKIEMQRDIFSPLSDGK